MDTLASFGHAAQSALEPIKEILNYGDPRIAQNALIALSQIGTERQVRACIEENLQSKVTTITETARLIIDRYNSKEMVD